MSANSISIARESGLHLQIDGTPMAVRSCLREIFSAPILAHLCDADRGTAEIVLAEALNNIVEHAYAKHTGTIAVDLAIDGTELLCKIVDHGIAMPGEVLPTGELRIFDNWQDLPEGGFGWHLIRTLSRALTYHRRDNANVLCFRLDARQS